MLCNYTLHTWRGITFSAVESRDRVQAVRKWRGLRWVWELGHGVWMKIACLPLGKAHHLLSFAKQNRVSGRPSSRPSVLLASISVSIQWGQHSCSTSSYGPKDVVTESHVLKNYHITACAPSSPRCDNKWNPLNPKVPPPTPLSLKFPFFQ